MKTKTLYQLEEKYIGPVGSEKRNKYEKELSDLLVGQHIREGRIKLDMTQEQLAERVGKNIVETGLGGTLKVEIVF